MRIFRILFSNRWCSIERDAMVKREMRIICGTSLCVQETQTLFRIWSDSGASPLTRGAFAAPANRTALSKLVSYYHLILKNSRLSNPIAQRDNNRHLATATAPHRDSEKRSAISNRRRGMSFASKCCHLAKLSLLQVQRNSKSTIAKRI